MATPRLYNHRSEAATAIDMDKVGQPSQNASTQDFSVDAGTIVKLERVTEEDEDQELDVDADDDKESLVHRCDSCRNVFNSAALLIRHRCKSMHRCTACPWSGTTRAQLRAHRLEVHDRKPHACPECGSRFASPYHLRRHMVVHLKATSSCACPGCGANFNSVWNLNRHKRQCRALAEQAEQAEQQQAGRPAKGFVCMLCTASFWGRPSLVKHIQKVHTLEHRFKCPVCVSSYPSQGSLSYHMRVHRAKRPFTCSVCAESFSRRSRMLKHLMTHMPPEEVKQEALLANVKSCPSDDE